MVEHPGRQSTGDDSSKRVTVCRFGCVYAVRDGESRDGSEGNAPLGLDYAALTRALDRDPRVIHCDPPDDDRLRIYPRFIDTDDADVTQSATELWSRALTAETLVTPVVFEIAVAPSNQQDWIGSGEGLPELYRCAWNGAQLVIAFEHAGSAPVHPLAGQVVKATLRESLESLGYEVKIQGPTFAHVELVIPKDTPEDGPWTETLDDRTTVLRGVEIDNPNELLRAAFATCRAAMDDYYELENRAEALLAAREVIGERTAELLKIQHERSLVRVAPWAKRPRAALRLVGSRSRARALIAEIWLALAISHDLHQTAVGIDDRIAATTGLLPAELLFRSELARVRSRLQKFDPSLEQGVVESVASRLDNHDIVVATAGGALAGGILGAALVAILG